MQKILKVNLLFYYYLINTKGTESYLWSKGGHVWISSKDELALIKENTGRWDTKLSQII